MSKKTRATSDDKPAPPDSAPNDDPSDAKQESSRTKPSLMSTRITLAFGVLLVLVGIANAILTQLTPGSWIRHWASLLPIAAGAVAIVRTIRMLAEDPPAPAVRPSDDPEIQADIEIVLPPRPLNALEALRWFGMLVGASGLVVGLTHFRFALFDEDLAIGSLVACVVGVGLFGWLYWIGTPIQRRLPKRADLWDRAATWVVEHGAVPALVLLTAVTAMMFSTIFLGETTGDDLTFHMAESRRIADCIRDGDWDFWNPSANGGYASAYYYQVIPQLASALPTAIFGEHLFWFQLSLWLPQVAIPLAAYRGMRLLGAAPWQALCAAFAVTFLSGASRWGSGADGTFQVGLYTQTWALAAFPLGLGHAVRYFLDGKGLPAAIAWGAFVFLCHPFASIALCVGLAFGVLAHYLRFPLRHTAIKWILLALIGAALMINLAGLIFDPVPPPKPDVEIDWKPKVIYIAPLILFAGLFVRVATSRRLLTTLLLVGVGLAFLANALGFVLFEAVPKRPEGATEDLPAQWFLSGAILYLGPMLLLAALAGRLAFALRRPAVEQPTTPTRAPQLLGFAMATAVATVSLLVLGALHKNGSGVVIELGVAFVVMCSTAGMAWLGWQIRDEPLVRLVLLGICLIPATAPGWATVIVDGDGFGGFPHRVADEVGPGYQELMRWYTKGGLLDNARFMILTWALPLVVLFARTKFGRWLWAPILVYATLLALGPHTPKTGDDLLPLVRFLGALQIMIGLAIGAGLYAIGAAAWHLRWAELVNSTPRDDAPADSTTRYAVRTAVIAVAAVLVVFLTHGGRVVASRVNYIGAFDYEAELREMNDAIAKQPQGKRQVGPGAENHWWNLLPYVYVRSPTLLQMGGGGLQASPNYDFLWSVREFPKLAWVYDAPLFVFARASSSTVPSGQMLHQTEHYELRRLPAPGAVSPIEITGVLPEGESKARSPVRIAAIDWLKSADPLANKHLAYHDGGLRSAPKATVVRAFHVDPSPGDLADVYAEVQVEKPTTFVMRESWHPRWHAYIDGESAPIRRVTPDFPAIDVEPGKHTLAFRFERPWWAHVVWLLFPGVPLGIWLVARVLRRRREPPRAPVV